MIMNERMQGWRNLTTLIFSTLERSNECKGDGIKLTTGEGKGVIVSRLEKFGCEPESTQFHIAPTV